MPLLGACAGNARVELHTDAATALKLSLESILPWGVSVTYGEGAAPRSGAQICPGGVFPDHL